MEYELENSQDEIDLFFSWISEDVSLKPPKSTAGGHPVEVSYFHEGSHKPVPRGGNLHCQR